MAKEGVSFKVEGNKFWVLEQRLDEEKEETKEGEYSANSWVFSKENEAISKLQDLLEDEDIEVDELEDEDIERLGDKYNLQEVEIAEEKYEMRALSWFKIALRMGLGQK